MDNSGRDTSAANAFSGEVAVRPAVAPAAPAAPTHSRPQLRKLGNDLIRQASVAIVDDEPINIKVTQKYLSSAGYQNFVTTTEAPAALELIRRERPDVVLLDIMMPVVSGLEILEALRSEAELASIPVLILTAATDPEIKVRALELGATDFLAKPVDPSELVPRVRNVLVVKAHQDHLARYAQRLETEVSRRTQELAVSRQEILEVLARAAEYRDENTGQHIIRVGKYAAIVARRSGLDHRAVELIEQAAQLHDVGKIGIPDNILKKPGKLERAEYQLMKEHCYYGQKILQKMSQEEFELIKKSPEVGEKILSTRSSELVRLAAKIAISHHEWWDGSGYPRGLTGCDIPLEGRITAVADVYDALSTQRPYKPSLSVTQCLELMYQRRGTQFDPQVFDTFVRGMDEILEAQRMFADC